jgi:uncharacterized membrane protein
VSRADAGGHAPLDAYLRRLDVALARVPEAERREILLETRSHAVERTGRYPGPDVDAVLAELGPPEEYARRFLPADEEATAPAPSPSAPWPRGPGALDGVARLATAGWASLPLLVLVVIAYAVAGIALLVGVDKLLEPEATGFFVRRVGEKVVAANFVVSDPIHAGQDELGYWLVPLAFGLAAAIHLVVSAILRRAYRDDPRIGRRR